MKIDSSHFCHSNLNFSKIIRFFFLLKMLHSCRVPLLCKKRTFERKRRFVSRRVIKTWEAYSGRGPRRDSSAKVFIYKGNEDRPEGRPVEVSESGHYLTAMLGKVVSTSPPINRKTSGSVVSHCLALFQLTTDNFLIRILGKRRSREMRIFDEASLLSIRGCD